LGDSSLFKTLSLPIKVEELRQNGKSGSEPGKALNRLKDRMGDIRKKKELSQTLQFGSNR